MENKKCLQPPPSDDITVFQQQNWSDSVFWNYVAKTNTWQRQGFLMYGILYYLINI